MLFAPHVGISPSGVIGKYQRNDQDHVDTACGAAVGAYNQVCKLKAQGPDSYPPAPSESDYQFDWIISKLFPHFDLINSKGPGNPQQAEIVKAMYVIVRDSLDSIAKSLPHGKLVLLGGIQINMSGEDSFQPLLFEVREAGKPNVDLLPALNQA